MDSLFFGPSDSEMECMVNLRGYVSVKGLVIPRLDCGCMIKPKTRMHSNSSWCRRRTLVASILIHFFMFSMSPTFMHGIMHRGDWMKRDLAKPICGQLECGSPIIGWFIALINEKFIPLIFVCKFIGVYMDFYG